MGLTVLVVLPQALGFGLHRHMAGQVIAAPTTVFMPILSVVFLVFAIYMLVLLGFLRGTPGPTITAPTRSAAAPDRLTNKDGICVTTVLRTIPSACSNDLIACPSVTPEEAGALDVLEAR